MNEVLITAKNAHIITKRKYCEEIRNYVKKVHIVAIRTHTRKKCTSNHNERINILKKPQIP